MNSDHQLSEDLEKQLTRVYVALAMTRDVAKRSVNIESTDEGRALLTFLNVASELVEKILDPQLAEAHGPTTEVNELDAIM